MKWVSEEAEKEEKAAVEKEEEAMNISDSPKCRCKNLSDRHHLSNTKICPEMLSRHKTHYPVKFSLQYHSNPLYRIGMI